MSRLGDLIRTERIRQKMTPKQVAKKCGVSESFILAVEAGTRIIADDQARRILKNIGLREQTEADFTLDDIAATVDLQTVQPAMVKKPAAPKVEKVASTEETPAEGVAGSVWLDALSSVLKRVPVLNAVMKPVDHRLLPILNGRIEGANPEKVFYFLPRTTACAVSAFTAGTWPWWCPHKAPSMARSCWWNTAPTAPCARSKSWTASKCSCNPMTGSTTRKPWRSPM